MFSIILQEYRQGRGVYMDLVRSMGPVDSRTGGHQPHKSNTRDSFRSPSFLELLHARVLLNHVTIIKPILPPICTKDIVPFVPFDAAIFFWFLY
jgi:hypothetical protein